jgi:ABC-type glycerol-3-phosphate transport system permease component
LTILFAALSFILLVLLVGVSRQWLALRTVSTTGRTSSPQVSLMISIAPIILLYALFSDIMIKGMTAGAVR